MDTNTTLYRESCDIKSPVLLLDGVIKQSKRGSKGKNVIIRFAKVGEILGFRSFITDELACTTTATVTQSKIGIIKKVCLLNILNSNPEFSIKLIRQAYNELEQTQYFILNLTQKQIRGRVASALLYLKNTFGLDNNRAINTTVSRKEFASLIGAAPESVIRMLSEFNDDRIIELMGKKIYLINQNILIKYSNWC